MPTRRAGRGRYEPGIHVLGPRRPKKPGMGESLFCVSEVKAVLDCASDVLGYDVAELMTNAPAESSTTRGMRSRPPARCPWVSPLLCRRAVRSRRPCSILVGTG